MAELQLSDQPTLTDTELDDSIIAIQGGDPAQWRKVTPLQLLTLLGVGNAQGQLIATMTLPTGDIDDGQRFENWVLESGIPSGFSVADRTIRGTTYTDTTLHVPKTRVIPAQQGWLVSLVVNDVVREECTFNFGHESNSAGAFLIYGNVELRVRHSNSSTTTLRNFYATADYDFTIPGTDTVELKLYILQ